MFLYWWRILWKRKMILKRESESESETETEKAAKRLKMSVKERVVLCIISCNFLQYLGALLEIRPFSLESQTLYKVSIFPFSLTSLNSFQLHICLFQL
ncbi:hypothetical protein L1987_83555 [Smallanthus sonchifolius]|uniref:Uncharacterized protein n=1 Tax=Smallanthus sonchifolius TaxID=185202 RepID=A0ACB8YCW9_9ASTR|nr:hypothetical protein L1987_83555 [Smallanthus sonchifolius]